MFLTSRKFVKKLLAEHGIHPSKRLGQHFLVDRGVLRDIIAAAELTKDDMVLEIGPGIGTLTVELAKRAKKVVAIEKDEKMCEILKSSVKNWGTENVNIVNADILKIKIRSWKLFGNWKLEIGNSYKVVANLPYYIVAPVIRLFLEAERPPQLMVLMVQKEVAQRICAKPPRMNLLAVSVQFYAEPKIVRYVRKTSFWPQPKVDSAIIKIVPHQFHVPVPRQFREQFFRIVKAGFSQPRKQLINNLSRGLKLDRTKLASILSINGIEPTKRAESLTLDKWQTLARIL